MSNIPAIRLDPKRAYGEISPPLAFGDRQACWSQVLYGTNEEVYFDAALDILPEALSKKALASIKESQARKEADEAGDAARKAALKKAGLSDSSSTAAPQLRRQRSGSKPAAPVVDEDDDSVDLQAWADGKEKYRFAVVQDYVFERYNYRGTDAVGLKKWLADPDQHDGVAIIKAAVDAD